MRRSFMRSVCTLNIEVRPADAILTSVATETPLASCNAHLAGIKPQACTARGPSCRAMPIRTHPLVALQAMGIMQHGGHRGDKSSPSDGRQNMAHTQSAVVQTDDECPASAVSPQRSAWPLEMPPTDGGMEQVSAIWLPAPGLSADSQHTLLQQPGLLLRPSSAASVSPERHVIRDPPAGHSSAASREREHPQSQRQSRRRHEGHLWLEASVECPSHPVHHEPVVIDVRSQLRNSMPKQYVRMQSAGQHKPEVVSVLGQHTYTKPTSTPKEENIVRKSLEKSWRT